MTLPEYGTSKISSFHLLRYNKQAYASMILSIDVYKSTKICIDSVSVNRLSITFQLLSINYKHMSMLSIKTTGCL